MPRRARGPGEPPEVSAVRAEEDPLLRVRIPPFSPLPASRRCGLSSPRWARGGGGGSVGGQPEGMQPAVGCALPWWDAAWEPRSEAGVRWGSMASWGLGWLRVLQKLDEAVG